jgi:hypothetical protein
MAVMSRVDTPAAARRPFYLYLDEFQSFTGVAEASYEKILSRARKYNLGLTLAHQQTGQIPNTLLQEVLGNVSTMIAFSVSATDAAKLCREFVVSRGGLEADHIPDDFLLTLKVGEAWGKIGKTVFPFKTWLADQNPDPIRAKEVMERSRMNYGRPANDEARTVRRTPRVIEKQAQNGTSPAKLTVQEVPVDDDPFLDPSKVF